MAEPIPGDMPVSALGAVASEPAPTAARAARRPVWRNAVSLLYSQSLTWVLATAIGVIQPRFLGPDAQGQLRLAYSVWLIAQVFIGLGTSTPLILEVARHDEAGVVMLPTALSLRLVSSLVATLGVTGYLLATGASAATALIFTLVGIAFVTQSFAGALRSVILGFERMSYVAIADVAVKLTQTATVLTALFMGGSAREVAGALAFSALIGPVFMIVFVRRLAPVRLRFTLSGARTLLAVSTGFLAAEAIVTVYQQINPIMLSILVTKTEIGWYGGSEALFASILFVPSILMTALLPVIGRLYVDDPARLRQLVDRTFASLVLFGVPLGLGTTVVARPLCTLLYGDDFRQAGDVLGIMGVVVVLVFTTILFGQVAIATGRQRLWNITMLCGITVSVGLNLLLVPWAHREYGNGALGGGLAYLVTEGMMVVVGLKMVVPYAVTRSTLVRTTKILVAGAAMMVAAWPWRGTFVAVPIVVGALVYGAAIIGTGALTEFERMRVRGLLHRLAR